MTRRKLPEPATAAGYQGWFEREFVTYYHGHATIMQPAASPPYTGWTESHVTCTHRHTDPEAAEKCGRALGAREAARINKGLAARFAGTSCDLAVSGEPRVYDDEPGYIRYCAAHQCSATKYHRTEAEATADPWACPWRDA